MQEAVSVLSLLALLLSLSGIQALAQETTNESPNPARDHRRDLWMLGISIGAGPGHLQNKASNSTMDEWGGVLQLRGGGMIHPKLLFHLDLEGWFRDQLVGSSTYKVDMFQYSLALTWFPFDPAARSGGWWFRGGLGHGHRS